MLDCVVKTIDIVRLLLYCTGNEPSMGTSHGQCSFWHVTLCTQSQPGEIILVLIIHTICLCHQDMHILLLDLTTYVVVTLSWASDVTPEEGFIFVAIEPGMVKTDGSTAMCK